MTATMEPLVDTLTEDPRWEAFGLGDLAEPAARATLASLGLPPDGFAISLLGCSDARIAVLNADCDTKQASAARPKCSDSVSARKYRSCLMVGRFINRKNSKE